MAVSSEAYVFDSLPAAGDYRMPRQALLRSAGATSHVGMLSLETNLVSGLANLLAETQVEVLLTV
jgi:hypothetical protein